MTPEIQDPATLDPEERAHRTEIAELVASIERAPALVNFLYTVGRRGTRATFAELVKFTAQLEMTLAQVALADKGWTEEDQPLPEDSLINAMHPLQTGDYAAHAEATRMVGAKRSKHAIVDLVNWLLTRAVAAEQDVYRKQTIMRRADRERAAAETRAQNLEAEAERWSERFFRKCDENARLASIALDAADIVQRWGSAAAVAVIPASLIHESQQLVKRAEEAEPVGGAEPSPQAAIAALRELEGMVTDPHALVVIQCALGLRT